MCILFLMSEISLIMGRDLNLFELSIMTEVLRCNRNDYPSFEKRLPNLRVGSVEKTGVGMSTLRMCLIKVLSVQILK